MLMAALGMGLSTLVEALGSREKALATETQLPDGREVKLAPEVQRSKDGKRVSHVLLVALAFIVAIALLDRSAQGTTTGRSVLAGTVIALGWTLTLYRRPGIAAAFREYWVEGTSKVADIAPFFIAMGIFSTGIEESGLLELAGPLLQSATVHLGATSVILIALLIIAGSLIGFYPFMTIVLFGKILAYSDIPLPQLTIALGILSGSVSSYMVTPFAGVIMAIARSIGVRAIDVAFNWNWRFCLVFFVMTMAFAFAWGACFG